MSTTIWTNGCFDCLHAGHIELLEHAKRKGDKLVVGIDSDERVRLLKGTSRPVHTQEQRKKVLESIRFVDHVVIFSSEEELVSCIKECGASIIVVGSDYKGKRVIGEDVVPVDFFERIPGLSSTRILNGGKDHV